MNPVAEYFRRRRTRRSLAELREALDSGRLFGLLVHHDRSDPPTSETAASIRDYYLIETPLQECPEELCATILSSSSIHDFSTCQHAMRIFFAAAPEPLLSAFLEEWWVVFLRRWRDNFRESKLGIYNMCCGYPYRHAEYLQPTLEVLSEVRNALDRFDSLPLEILPPGVRDPFMGTHSVPDSAMKAHSTEFYHRLVHGKLASLTAAGFHEEAEQIRREHSVAADKITEAIALGHQEES